MNLTLTREEIDDILYQVYSEYNSTEKDTIQDKIINNRIQTAILKIKTNFYIKILKNNE